MAYQSDWVAGTVSVTNGSTAVTGVGTVWNGAGLAEGDTLIINNLVGVILTVNNALSITLAQPWQGASATNVAYRARYMSDGARYTAVAKQVLQDLQAGNVSALAGLTGAANKIPMFTGPGAMSLLDAGTVGKAVLAAATQDAAASAGGFVRNSGGVNMASNGVRTGWATAGDGVLVQVDLTQLGYMWTDNYVATNPASRRAALGAFASAGGAITGPTSVAGNLVSTGEIRSTGGVYYADRPNGQAKGYGYLTSGQLRWNLECLNNNEGGSNTGSDWQLSRFNDAGSYQGPSISVNRRYGTVETRETPLANMYPGTGQVTLTAGMHIGALGASNGFDFSRGNFTIGGNPGAGGRAVHVPLTAWYRVTATAVCNAPSGASVFGVGLNGMSWVAMYAPVNGWTSLARTVVAYLNANAYLTWCGVVGSTNMSLENTSLTVEFIQF